MIPRRFRVSAQGPWAMARALVAKAVYDMPTSACHRLDTDVVLRRICGWERRSEVPSESVFSRAFAEFSDTQWRVHEALQHPPRPACGPPLPRLDVRPARSLPRRRRRLRSANGDG